ncbi:membrane-bound lytic murein transglycosylase MltF [Usitatibacter palustris]|uniref:Membrane-bound lytic murein transglycosylase F n=1 Tax=Usitatibacter palustris TaxID=2732487 RepID=A0A6M4H9W0_9PROT|nr:membrane-bound lytic murein transglycosylase MltF [Usitatibacter palustris]QJR15503.1 Membrane-bound lytic murein transglycosylase F [Usitatibacter palustris]
MARILLCLVLLCAGCDMGSKPVAPIEERGALVVLTINGPETYFEDAQGHPSGFEHDLVVLFAKELGTKVEFITTDSPSKVEAAIKRGTAHLAAAALVRRLDFPGGITWGPTYLTLKHQIVYRAADPKPKALPDISGKRVGVVEESQADALLSEPPKLAVPIERMPPGTTTMELLASVAEGKLDYALVESNRFTLARKHFPQLDLAFDLGKPEQYAWLVSTVDKKRIVDAAKPFFERITKDGTLTRLVDRYYGHAVRISAIDSGTLLERIQTMLPSLKPAFIAAEVATGVDWRLLAAVGYQESHWDASATSPTGVRGLMMLTEETALRLKVKDRLSASESILGGARYLALLKETLPPRIVEPDRTFLALAAYNLGIGHLEDARILAQRSGLSPDQWHDVKQVIRRLADPAVYHTLKHGFARGHEGLQFVDNVRNYLDILDRIEPRVANVQSVSREPSPDKSAPPVAR